MEDNGHLQNLLQQLLAKDWKTRQLAAKQLGELGDCEALPYLVKCLDDRSIRVRHSAISALAKLNDPSIIQPLLHVFLNTTDSVLFSVAAYGLGKIKAEVTIEPFRRKFSDRHINSSVMFAFLEFGERIHELLQSMLKNGNSNEKLNSAQAISQWWHQNLHRDWIRQVAVPLMIDNLNDPDDYTRGYTAVVLSDMRELRAFDRILELARDTSDYVRWCFAGMIVKYEDLRAIPALEWIRDNDKAWQIVKGQEESCKQYNADVAKQSIARLRGEKTWWA